jgi:hypothetical protein
MKSPFLKAMVLLEWIYFMFEITTSQQMGQTIYGLSTI